MVPHQSSKPKSVRNKVKPKAPDQLEAVETGNYSIKLQWTPVDSNQLYGYLLESSDAGKDKWSSVYPDLPVLSHDTTEFDVDVTPYKVYDFCVKSAIKKDRKATYSEGCYLEDIAARQQYQPYRPRTVRVTDIKENSVTLTWLEPPKVKDVNPTSYRYIIEICCPYIDGNILNEWTECCRTTLRRCTIKVQHNGNCRFRVSTLNKDKDVISLPQELEDPEMCIRIEKKSPEPEHPEPEQLERLQAHMRVIGTTPTSQRNGSVIFGISCHDSDSLRELWMNYRLGNMAPFFKDLFALKVNDPDNCDEELDIEIDEEDFYACRQHLLLTCPNAKGFRVVKTEKTHSRACTTMGLSEEYPVYCKPMVYNTTCSQLDYLDPALLTNQGIGKRSPGTAEKSPGTEGLPGIAKEPKLGASKMSTRETGPIESSIKTTEKSAGTIERSSRTAGAMDAGDRKRLRMNHCLLKRTVSTWYITGYLYEKGTLTTDDVDQIYNQTTEEDKMETLLFMLPRKGDGAFQKFCSALKEKRDGASLYKDMAEKLESTVVAEDEKEDQQGASPEVHKDIPRWDFLRKHRRDIATCLDTEKTCLLLINSDVLTERERNVIEREESPPERAQTLLRILPTKGTNAFHAFHRALKEQDRDDLAALLIGEPGRVYNPVSNVAKSVSHFFYSEAAKKVNQAMEGGQFPIVLSGITGSGKTQLALWQAELFVERHPTAVVWRLDGHDKKSFLTDKQNLLERLKEKVPSDDSQVDACVAKALDSRQTPVMLIMDDLDDGRFLSPELLKPREESKIVIITHRKHLQQKANVSIPDESYVTINGFSDDEAVDFLQMQLQQHPPGELRRLASKFSGLPLGLAAAPNYLWRTKTSMNYYLNLLEKRETVSILEEEANKWMSQFYEKPELQKTGRNLFAALRLAVSKLDQHTKSMFHLTGYMDQTRIPIVILREDVDDSPAKRNMALNQLAMQVEDLSLGTIEGLGNDRVLYVHKVTQLVLRLSLTEDQEKERLKKLQDILLKYFVKDNRYTKSARLTELLQPHVEKDHLEQLAGINWVEVNSKVVKKLHAHRYESFVSYDKQGNVEEKSVKESEVLYWKLSAVSKRLPEEVFNTMIQSRVIAEQDLALFSALGKAPADLDESVRNKEPLTPVQYQEMVENGIAIPIERMKEVYLPELYASISYSLGRCFFYMKEKYADDPEGKHNLIRNMQLAYYMCDQIKKHSGIPVMHKYLSQTYALLYLRLEEEGKSPDELRRDVKYAIKRYSELVEGGGDYFEFGILKKSGQDSYNLMMCHRQLVKCYNALLKLADSEEERMACIEQAQIQCWKMIEHAEKQVQRDAYGKIVERPERLAVFYNTAGRFFADDSNSAKLDEALDWFRKAYDLEKEKAKEDYPLSDALFGLAEVLVRRNHDDDLERAEGYIRELLELYNRKWPNKKAEIETAKKIQAQIAQLI
ncbi:Hypp8668 [Branchiostoma lanceolatum]|uniref:Hypp8668 protein n=1 Tax=Branchiostoma lanceolatum TaxID=7740 RepID=A0A8J9ZAG3_BRALA|nr:Hypp8668 [Branchiostoma lanceolatum]